jgi:MOSC domain-containing protein YiiM
LEILSINIGKERKIIRTNVERVTGIYKQPTEGPVEVTTLGLVNDVIGDKKHHGGPDQALYLYGQADYNWWAEQLGRELPPGTFGENLTISGLESTAFNIGDKLLVGKVILQVTSPRLPCATLSTRMEDPQFVKKFKDAERPGLYCRVLQAGQIAPGDTVTIERYQGDTVSLLEMYRDAYDPDKSEAGLRRFLAAPIDERSRAYKEALLASIL